MGNEELNTGITGDIESLEEENRALKEDIKKLTAQRNHLQSQLSMAEKLKYHLMPNVYPPFPDVKSIDVFADSIAIKQIGGDFYDIFRIDNDHIGIVMADIFDGGVASSLYMIAFKLYLTSQLNLEEETLPDRVETINNLLCWKNEDDLSLSAWYGVYEISTGRVEAVNAGHDKPLILSKNGLKSIEDEKIDYLLGVIEGMKYESYEFTLDEGDKLLLYTDGVINAEGDDEAAYGIERLRESFVNTGSKSAESTVAALQSSFRSFVGNNALGEDASFLCLARKEGE
ncbi:MAG: SpoIIE family protein phosphatase [Butyrivibrio sp.]|nr:SpoIIE family protein phosphatase [Butyrivibrio sp.]